MHSEKNNDDFKKSNGIDSLSDDELDRLFNRMQLFFDSEEFKEIVEDIMYDVLSDDDEEEDSYFKPSFEDSSNFFDASSKSSFIIDNHFLENYIEDHSPEVVSRRNLVMITLSVPQAQKNDIDLHVTNEYVDITVNTRNQRYHRMVDLPVDVDPGSTKATFTNGVLDIIIRKAGSHNRGQRISIS